MEVGKIAAMFKRAWEYVAAVLPFYKVHVSGWLMAVAGIGLAVAAAVVVEDSRKSVITVRVAAGLTFGIAVMLSFVAQYDAWRQERDEKLRAREELDAEADMRGEIYLTARSSHASDVATLGYVCDCVNLGRKACQISRLIVYAETDNGQDMREIMLDPQSIKTVQPGQRFSIAGDIPFFDATPGHLAQWLAEDTITIHLMDSSRREYPNTATVVPASI